MYISTCIQKLVPLTTKAVKIVAGRRPSFLDTARSVLVCIENPMFSILRKTNSPCPLNVKFKPSRVTKWGSPAPLPVNRITAKPDIFCLPVSMNYSVGIELTYLKVLHVFLL